MVAFADQSQERPAREGRAADRNAWRGSGLQRHWAPRGQWPSSCQLPRSGCWPREQQVLRFFSREVRNSEFLYEITHITDVNSLVL